MAAARQFEIYRYDPDRDEAPHMQVYDYAPEPHDRMLLDGVPVVLVEPGQVRRSGAAARIASSSSSDITSTLATPPTHGNATHVSRLSQRRRTRRR